MLLNVAFLNAALWALACSTLTPTLLWSHRHSLLCKMMSSSVIFLGSLKKHSVLLGFDSGCIVKMQTLLMLFSVSWRADRWFWTFSDNWGTNLFVFAKILRKQKNTSLKLFFPQEKIPANLLKGIWLGLLLVVLRGVKLSPFKDVADRECFFLRALLSKCHS